MKIWKCAVLWYLGGMSYVALELLWRGWSHGSMFVVGGVCFLLLGNVERLRLPLAVKMMAGACLVTGLELLTGLVVNLGLGMDVWDYSGLPCNLLGQICLPYLLLWNPVALGGMFLSRGLRRLLFGERKSSREPSPGSRNVIVRFQPEGL